MKTWASKKYQIWLEHLIWMLQNARVTDFTISEFFRENQQMVKWLLEFKEVYLNSSPVPLTIFYEAF